MKSDRSTVDPRYFQITILATLLGYGLLSLNFPISVQAILLTVSISLLTQLLFTQALQLDHFEAKSALITAFSICLLLRTDQPWLLLVAAILAIASKFLLRYRNKHIFNPANFALVLITLVFDHAWFSAGQWGGLAWFALLVSGLGLLVVIRSSRIDITLAFLGFYSLLVFGRALWLGDPLTIPLHQLQSGALLIFAFFMISDPVTSPDSRTGRIIFAACVTLGAGFTQFVLYKSNGVFYSLILACLLTPLINLWFPGSKFRWNPQQR